jgi:hypothetical protein
MEPKLLDTAPLRDQRTMVGPWTHASPDDVVAGWDKWVNGHERPHSVIAGATEAVPGAGLIVRKRRGDLSTDLRESSKTLVVYVSGGRWIADCPDCNGGVPAWPGHDRGCCLDCGTVYRLAYPPEAEIREVVALLAVRPELDRNYWCHRGDTVEKLRAENVAAGWTQQASFGVIAIPAAALEQLSPRTRRELQKAGLV